ncbi:hypothetical protein BDZ94DRAFT_1168287 [Collybia nuda]|uniref:DUF4470 domain-containing protein n=1 Tax=Collybia nuda TaxID=64659 RepID=A0A9P6CCV1_9AGAR|nr:hypothetical protein BDZ94DRAFT_1168287 [Collybia nuda]
MASPTAPTKEPFKAKGVGSGPDGQSMSRLLCANITISDTTTPSTQCNKAGTMACSKYCSKECQTLHWKKHRSTCKSPYLNKAWQPAWIMENRAPDFVVGSDEPTHTSFGLPAAYLWGNIPAIDCLNIVHNEGQIGLHQDFKFCFAASGDIRNLVSTVNGLPDQYSGNCQILFNDLNPLVVGHNLVVLSALLSPEYSIEDAAELALNLMYSTTLTPSMSSSLSQIKQHLSNIPPSQIIDVPTTGKGSIQALVRPQDLESTLGMLRSSYDVRKARQGYHNIMLSPERKDYRDRYMAALKPGHRLGFSKFRESGVLAPFSLDISDFTEPNRLLFSPQGYWLLRDSENPLSGWNFAAAKKSGHAHGVDEADVYGNLFFHIKGEFIKFATRFRKFDIGITLTLFDACVIPQGITDGLLPPFHKSCFDRIETSNIADYVTIPRIIDDWSPMLNRKNKNASLLMSLMNWRQNEEPDIGLMRGMDKRTMQHNASIMGIDIALVGQKYSPSMFQFVEGLPVFKDDTQKFQAYLQKTEALKAVASHSMRIRTKHRIHPKRAGFAILKTSETIPKVNAEEYYDTFTLSGSRSTTRFMEFEASI